MTTTAIKPMLAGKAPEDLSLLTYPVLASPKIDGIRCTIRNGKAVSRTNKPIPNDSVRNALEGLPDGIDGELLVEGGFNVCQSFFMKKGAVQRDWWLFAFDWDKGHPSGNEFAFAERLEMLTEWSEEHGHNNLTVVEHALITNETDLREYTAQCLADGFEGAMVRDPGGGYKHGRSSFKQGGLLKIKHFEDEEAVVFAVEELMHNDNEATKDDFGRTKRSTHKANKRPAGTMGKLACRTIRGQVEFRIGTGFTQAVRDDIWKNRKVMPGQIVKFKHQPDPGGRRDDQAPRIPVFLGFRSPEDM